MNYLINYSDKFKSKFEVFVGEISRYEKEWLILYPQEKSWMPSFEDLFYIIKTIAEIEESKYPFGEGRKFVANFFYEAAGKANISYETLAKKFKIPSREARELQRELEI